MLKGRLIALVAAAAILGGASQVGAYDILIEDGFGDLGGHPGDVLVSDVVVLTNTVELTGTEGFAGWDWTVFCNSGCVVVVESIADGRDPVRTRVDTR